MKKTSLFLLASLTIFAGIALGQAPACSVLVYPRFVVPNASTGTPGTGTPITVYTKLVPATASLPDTYAVKFRGGDGLLLGLTWMPVGDHNPANGDTGLWYNDAAAWLTGTRQNYFTDATPQYFWVQGKVRNTSTAGPDTFRVRARLLATSTSYDSPVYEVTALNMASNGGWIEGNVYSDAGFTVGYQRHIILAFKADTIASIYISENNKIRENLDSTDAGYFKMGVPTGNIDSIQIRDTLNNIVSSYVRTSPPWSITAGQVTNINGDITSPTITGASPANGATEVALDATIYIAFSEPMDTLSLAGSMTPSPNEEPAWNATMDTLFLIHDPMTANTSYTIRLTALTDLAGNPLPVLPDSIMFTTTVGDTIAPYITGVYPAWGATNVGLNDTIVIAFSEPMNTDSLDGYTNPFHDFTPGWNAAGDTFTLVPQDPYPYSTVMSVIVTAGIDLAGNHLAVLPDTVVRFTTAPYQGPVITLIQQPEDTYDGSGPLLVRAVITDLGKAGIAADTLWYTDNSTNWWALVHFSTDGDTFNYSIPGPLAAGTVIEFFFGAWDDGGTVQYDPGMYRGYQFRILDPLPPSGLAAAGGNLSVDLSWAPPAEVLSYYLTNNTGFFQDAGNITTTRFTPKHYPCKLEQVASSWWHFIGVDSVDVHVWADDGNGLPDRSVELVPPVTIMPLDYPAYTVVDLSAHNLVLSSGDFHVGYVIRTDNLPMPLCDSDGPGIRSLVYDSSASTWGNMVSGGTTYHDWSHEAAVTYHNYSKGLALKSYIPKIDNKPLAVLTNLKPIQIANKQPAVYPDIKGALFLAKNIAGYDLLRSNVSGGPYTGLVKVNDTTYTDTTVLNNNTYYYVVRAAYSTPDTTSDYSNEASATPTGVEGRPEVRAYALQLQPATPNPLTTGTTIRFSLPASAQASLEVFNVLGQKVTTLADGKLDAGYHTVNWTGTDRNGAKLASGVYIYQLRAMNKTLTKRMTIIR